MSGFGFAIVAVDFDVESMLVQLDYVLSRKQKGIAQQRPHGAVGDNLSWQM